MKATFVVLALLAGILIHSASPSHADTCGTGTIEVGSGDGGFQTGAEETQHSCGPDTTAGSGAVDEPTHTLVVSVCAGAHSAEVCDEPAYCADGTTETHTVVLTASGEVIGEYSNCPSDPAADPGPSLAEITSAFRRIPLPASVLQIQPPKGRTLVNFDTNFFTTADAFDKTVTLLGHDVDFAIRPARFEWAYGDGVTKSTTIPGAKYPTMGVTHSYQRKGTVKASVDTTWAARYRVDGGAWADVPDTVTIAGASQELTVVTATPLLADPYGS